MRWLVVKAPVNKANDLRLTPQNPQSGRKEQTLARYSVIDTYALWNVYVYTHAQAYAQHK